MMRRRFDPEVVMKSTRIASTAAAVVASGWLAGCATTPPPTEDLALGRAAVAEAVSAGAPQYAPDDLRRAEHALDRANEALARGYHHDARRFAQDAEADAKLAAATARSRKAERALDEVQTSVEALREEAQRPR
jgi:hypothetical protein